jgi:hypothetical protein
MGDRERAAVTEPQPTVARSAVGQVLTAFIKQRAEDHDKKRSKLDRDGKDLRDMVEKSTKAYEKSPEAKDREKRAKQILAQGALTVPPGAQVTKVTNPGLKGVLKSDVTLYAKDPTQGTSGSSNVEKGSKVVLHSTDNPNIFFIEAYKMEKKKLPDGKDSEEDDPMKHKIIAKGYALGNKVKLSQKFVKTDKPLFEKEPSPEDIKQGAIGDCFLLAGLGAMVSKDPGVIKRAILDNGDGTVTVRLFDKQGTRDKPTFEQKFITFEKSVLESDEGDHAKDSLWVQMMEKAYAIHGASKGESSSYLQLNAGGKASAVFEAFLGRAAAEKPIPSSKGALTKIETSLSDSIPISEVSPNDLSKMEEGLKKLGVSEQAIGKILAGYQGKTFMDLDGHRFRMGDVWPSIKEDDSIKGKVTLPQLKAVVSVTKPPERVAFESFTQTYQKLLEGGAVRADEVEALMLTNEFKALPANLQQAFRQKAQGQFPGKRGTGEYSEGDEAVWKTIEDGVKNEGCIAMQTKETVGSSQDSKGLSAGEPVSKGLVGKHVYTVTGIHVPKQGEELFVPGAKKPVKYVRIRNPWGDGDPPGKKSEGDEHGRTYEIVTNEETGEFIKMVASKTNKGEFYLELSDVTKRCEDVSTTPPLVSDEKQLTDQIAVLTKGTTLDPVKLDEAARGILYEEGMEAALAYVKKQVAEQLTDL